MRYDDRRSVMLLGERAAGEGARRGMARCGFPGGEPVAVAFYVVVCSRGGVSARTSSSCMARRCRLRDYAS